MQIIGYTGCPNKMFFKMGVLGYGKQTKMEMMPEVKRLGEPL